MPRHRGRAAGGEQVRDLVDDELADVEGGDRQEGANQAQEQDAGRERRAGPPDELQEGRQVAQGAEALAQGLGRRQSVTPGRAFLEAWPDTIATSHAAILTETVLTTRPKASLALIAAMLFAASSSAVAAERQVAVTFDDLPGPAAGLVSPGAAFVRDNTRKLLAAFKAHGVPVVGFVNENKLHRPGETAEDAALRLATLDMWLDAGLELGNHSFSHRSLNRTPLEEFEADVVRGETATKELLAHRGKTLRYFRHPFLQVGLDLDKRRAFEAFLKARGYTIAPVTMDNDEYMYAFVYADAVRRKDAALASKSPPTTCATWTKRSPTRRRSRKAWCAATSATPCCCTRTR